MVERGERGKTPIRGTLDGGGQIQTRATCRTVACGICSPCPRAFSFRGDKQPANGHTRLPEHTDRGLYASLHRSAPRPPSSSPPPRDKLPSPCRPWVERPEAIVGPAAYVAPELLLICSAAPPLCIHSSNPWLMVVPRRPPSWINISNTTAPRFQIEVAGAPELSHAATPSYAS